MTRRPRAPTITVDPGVEENFDAPSQAASARRRSLPGPYDARGPAPSQDSLDPVTARGRSPARPGFRDRRDISPNTFLDIPRPLPATQAPSRAQAANPRSGSRSPVSAAGSSFGTLSICSTQVTPVSSRATSLGCANPQPAPGAWHGVRQSLSLCENPFSVSPVALVDTLASKNLHNLHDFGGQEGLAKGLLTDLAAGLSVDETWPFAAEQHGAVEAHDAPQAVHSAVPSFAARKAVFGTNRLPEQKMRGVLQLMLIALSDKVLILLSVVAAISLALGLYQSIVLPHAPGQPRVEWIDGVTIIAAVLIVVVAGAVNDYQKERQFAKLNKTKEDRKVRAIRSGTLLEISIFDVLAGDLLRLEPGDLVPADGILVSGHGVRADESSITGESEQIEKMATEEALAKLAAGQDPDYLDPFIFSGSKILEGIGTCLVTGVGVNSTYGRLRMSLGERTEATPLQQQLGRVADRIAMAGVAAAVLLFLVLATKFLIQLPGSHASPLENAQIFLRIFVVSIAIVVIAVPEGLPLAVTLALAIAVIRMLKDNNLVRILAACETMGNATTVCCDKTGTLTMNRMAVTAGRVGLNSHFSDGNGDAMSTEEFVASLSHDMRDMLVESIAINSTAFEGNEDGKFAYIGSKMEAAILEFAKDHLGMRPLQIERANADAVDIYPFSSERKYMACVVKMANGSYRMYVKGAPEVLLERSDRVIRNVSDVRAVEVLTDENRGLLLGTINRYATRSLRTLGFAYKDFVLWPPPEINQADDLSEASFRQMVCHLTFLGIFGIRDPLRPGVREAVSLCQHAGVFVRMVTGDNVGTAQAVAKECGILTESGITLQGPEFRELPHAELVEMLPRLQLLARSTPEDKKMLVQLLKEQGEIVAVTGDGTNDGPALRAAHVGFSMGISGTEVAREASSIVLMNDNFSSIVKAIEWGRSVNDVIKKFLCFQLTANITAVTLTFITAVSSETEESVLTPVQLLWVNLIMDTFAALALATDPATPEVLDRKPEGLTAPLISFSGWKMIIGQAMYQLIAILVLHFAGNEIMGFTRPEQKETLETLVFNSYVWMQLFNLYNNRRLDNKLNVFSGALSNPFFVGVNVVIILGQVLIIFFGGSALSTTRLNATEWAVSLSIGFVTIPVGAVIRLMPDRPLRKWFALEPKKDHFDEFPNLQISHDGSHWFRALHNVRCELMSIRQPRSSRLEYLRDKILAHGKKVVFGQRDEESLIGETSPLLRSCSSGTPSRRSSTCAPAAVMAGFVAGSVAGWPRADPEAT
ncbi:plasma membrane calcium [Sporothrix eucalyptigena]